MNKKKIAILLPYKDHFTHSKAGSASIWVKDFNEGSKFRNNISVLGNADNQKDIIDKKRYVNINFQFSPFKSKNISYVDKFIKLNLKHKFSLIEVHNRPSYVRYLCGKKINIKYVLIFHNNPLNLGGSRTVSERMYLIENCDKIIFVSNWVKEKFFEALGILNHEKCIVIYPSVKPISKLPKKDNIISFVGKLNRSKGFHIFGLSIIKILNKYPNWNAIVLGDEPREKYNFKHKRLEYKGWLSHKKTLELYRSTSISVVPSFWDEPFGRTAMESASQGCATIISKKGGLIETVSNAVYLSDLKANKLYSEIEYLIKNKNKRLQLQKKSYSNVLHKLNDNTKAIDSYRTKILFNAGVFISKKSKFKIIHLSNFGTRLSNRLYFISLAKKISNGLIREGHDVINLSDRDTIRFNRSISGKSGVNYLNKVFLETAQNYSPDLIILGHSDNIKLETIENIKKNSKKTKVVQWFEDNLHHTGPDPDSNIKRLLQYEDYIDHNFITTAPSALKFTKNRKNFSYFPIPADKNIENLNIYRNKGSIYDLFFTMSHGVNRGKLKPNKKDERYPFLDNLIKKSPNILFDIYGYKNRQPIWSEDFYQVINNCKMGLNLSRTNSVKYYTSNRISSLIGNGLMTFVDKKTQLNHFFEDNEVIFYNNINDLSEKLSYYKENDSLRKKIAKNGQAKYFDLFNSEIVAQYMINKIFDLKFRNVKKWMKV